MPSLTKDDDRKRAAVAIVSPDKGSSKRARKTETGLSSQKVERTKMKNRREDS